MVANPWACGRAHPSYSLAFGTFFFNGAFVSGAVIRETMKQPAFTETRCALLGRGNWWRTCSKKAVSFFLLSFFLQRDWSFCQESIFFLCACFFTGPEETTDETWLDNRNHTGAELGQNLNKWVLFFGNCWKHSSPLPLGWNCLLCSTRAVVAALAGGHILLNPKPGKGGSGSSGSSPRCPEGSVSAPLPQLRTSLLPPLCFPLVIYWVGFCGCFLAECS